MTKAIVKANESGRVEITREIAEAIGPALVAEAREKRAKVIADSLMACTEDFFRQIEVMQERIDEAQKRIDQLRDRIADVEAGRFTVNKEGRVIFPHLPPPHIG